MSAKAHEPKTANVSASPSTSKSKYRKAIPEISASHLALITRRAAMEPTSLNQEDIVQLQRTIGNQTVMQLLSAAPDQAESPLYKGRDKNGPGDDKVTARVASNNKTAFAVRSRDSLLPIQRKSQSNGGTSVNDNRVGIRPWLRGENVEVKLNVHKEATDGPEGKDHKLPESETIQKTSGSDDISNRAADTVQQAAAACRVKGSEGYPTTQQIVYNSHHQPLHTAGRQATLLEPKIQGVRCHRGRGQVCENVVQKALDFAALVENPHSSGPLRDESLKKKKPRPPDPEKTVSAPKAQGQTTQTPPVIQLYDIRLSKDKVIKFNGETLSSFKKHILKKYEGCAALQALLAGLEKVNRSELSEEEKNAFPDILKSVKKKLEIAIATEKAAGSPSAQSTSTGGAGSEVRTEAPESEQRLSAEASPNPAVPSPSLGFSTREETLSAEAAAAPLVLDKTHEPSWQRQKKQKQQKPSTGAPAAVGAAGRKTVEKVLIELGWLGMRGTAGMTWYPLEDPQEQVHVTIRGDQIKYNQVYDPTKVSTQLPGMHLTAGKKIQKSGKDGESEGIQCYGQTRWGRPNIREWVTEKNRRAVIANLLAIGRKEVDKFLNLTH